MAFFLYNGDVHQPTGYRVMAFGKAFYKGGNPVEITEGRAIDKLTANPSFIALTSEDVAKMNVVTGDKAESTLLDDAEKPDTDGGEPDLSEADIDDMDFDELGEQLEELGIESKPRSREDRARLLKDKLKIG